MIPIDMGMIFDSQHYLFGSTDGMRKLGFNGVGLYKPRGRKRFIETYLYICGVLSDLNFSWIYTDTLRKYESNIEHGNQ